ncbi:MAG: bifunctional [glutamate--ammonia ligase]-adenylyl-L-tyrosine phosphorylase/[glutamate--ammonia-ligase] adenylyltransferase [Pseudomonadota bacterium]
MQAVDESVIANVRSYSRFVCRWMDRLGEDVFLKDNASQWTPAYLQQEVSTLMALDEGAFWTGMRILRQRIVISLVIADLSGQVGLEIVMHAMSDWADAAIHAGLEYYTPRLKARYGAPKTATGEDMALWVVGMGKLGGRELNVSSDVDLIFLYEEEGVTEGGRSISHTEFFSELGKKLISFLNTVTEYGQIFRVDMRLRPYGDSGPLVMSLEGIEEYFSTQGRLWERYAWVRAKLVNLNLPERAYELFTHYVQPFVYRRYWDFDAYEGLRDMYAKIRAEGQRKDLSQHIKLGQGGIRYIEFIAQLFQLVRGGRKPELRTCETLRAFEIIKSLDLMSSNEVDALVEDYYFLRNLEHRLQYKEDQQTHTLPSTEEGWGELIKAYPGLTIDALKSQIERTRARVSDYFSEVIQLSERSDDLSSCLVPPLPLYSDNEPLAAKLTEYGLHAEVANRAAVLIIDWMKSLRFRRLPERSQNSLEHVLPYLIKASIPHGEQALFRALEVLEAVSARSSYVALFREHPRVLDRLLRVLSASAWAGTYLKQYPLLLDELIHGIPDQGSLDADEAIGELYRAMSQAQGEEQLMDALRNWQRIQTFRCLCCDVSGYLTVEATSDYLSWIADQLIGAALRGAWQELPKPHCDTPHMAVLAYGKLGGKELGYGGDIDIVFLYDDPFDLAPVRYARLTQKWIHWMTALTPAGRLYEVDMRLRPEGESGLLIASWAAFEIYQRQRAHVWEHQALTRARWVAGDDSLKERFDTLRAEVLQQPRDRFALWEAIKSMRTKMRAQYPDTTHSFDLKKSRGGMIDIEFAVQYFVLGWSIEDPGLLKNTGNIALLRYLGDKDYLPKEIADEIAANYRVLRLVQHQCQLQGLEACIKRDDERVASWQASVDRLYEVLAKETNQAEMIAST